jgi:magnesium-transporting ATPase (P-type)
MSVLTLGVYVIAMYVEGYPRPPLEEAELPNRARGLAFATLVLIQLLHAFLARSLKDTVFRYHSLKHQ